MAEMAQRSWRRTFNRYIPLAAALVGVVIVLISFFARDMLWWLIGVACGLAIAILGFAYGGYPFLTSEREYSDLRREVESFIGLVRRLNRAGTAGSSEELDSAKTAMHESVERMAQLAGKREKP